MVIVLLQTTTAQWSSRKYINIFLKFFVTFTYDWLRPNKIRIKEHNPILKVKKISSKENVRYPTPQKEVR